VIDAIEQIYLCILSKERIVLLSKRGELYDNSGAK
jgi:hypothetical protein